MSLPTFYSAEKADTLFVPDLTAAYQAGAAEFKQAATQDKQRILAWFIDIQVDFVFPAPIGKLPVPNAQADTRRTIEWLYHNVQHITHIAASLDTHTPYQIFYPSWWKNAAGESPVPYTVITAKEVQTGVWHPVTEPEWSVYYLEQLESVGRKNLMIWPFHCMEGTVGRSLVPALAEAITFHSAARMAQPTYLTKGTIAQTEYYSVIEPEVKYPNHPAGSANLEFLRFLRDFDVIYVAGQARSHCVLESLNSFTRHFAQHPDIIGKLRLIDDATSSIAGFEDATEARLRELQAQGMQMTKSEIPII